MITKEDIKPGVRLKLLCDRGKALKGNGIRCEGTIITIKKIDIVRTEFEDTDGHVYEMIMLEDFDLAPSDLPTDRPLTYDETQMLQAGDVVKSYYGENLIIKTVLCSGITFKNETREWWLDKKEKDTSGDIYFVSHGKEESKEEKKEEVKGGFNSVTFNGVPIHSGNLQKECLYGCNVAKDTVIDASNLGITSLEVKSQEPMFDYMKKHREEHRKFLLHSTKDTKSVSQILYGR
jgi:hypothetical protein